MSYYYVTIKVNGKRRYWARLGYPGYFATKLSDAAWLTKDKADGVVAYLGDALKPKRHKVKTPPLDAGHERLGG